MLAHLFLLLTRRSTRARRVLFRVLFEAVARLSGGARWWTFMNYGYDGGANARALSLAPADEAERYCIQLYHRALAGIDVAGTDVLEVSCGRGGGVSYLRRYLAPKTVTGLDVAHHAIAFCRRAHRLPGLRFIRGEAENLPALDASLDRVLNVEASFCYADFDRFLAEVRRVLRPGGYFHFADLRLADEVGPLMAAFGRSGLTVLAADDIGAGVTRALARDAPRRAEAVRRQAPWLLRGAMRTFAGTEGSRIPALLERGEMRYLCCLLRKRADDLVAAARAAPTTCQLRSLLAH